MAIPLAYSPSDMQALAQAYVQQIGGNWVAMSASAQQDEVHRATAYTALVAARLNAPPSRPSTPPPAATPAWRSRLSIQQHAISSARMTPRNVQPIPSNAAVSAHPQPPMTVASNETSKTEATSRKVTLAPPETVAATPSPAVAVSTVTAKK